VVPRIGSSSGNKRSPFPASLRTAQLNLGCVSWRFQGISDHDLVAFDLEKDLVQVRSAPTSYGTIILGSIRLPAVRDDAGEGFVHVRIHDPPNRVSLAGPEDKGFSFHVAFGPDWLRGTPAGHG
jgi:hypothetical protein